MPTRILLRLLLLAGLAAPLCALALGVGPLEVRSALNQNLEAEIPLIVNNPAELVGLTVQIPRQQEFDRTGIERLEFLSKLRFAVQTTPGGTGIIRVTSIQPIREPSFDLLVEVIWPRGRLLRTFPVHLDPELYANRRQPSPPLLIEAPVVMPLAASPPVTTTAPTTPSLPSAPPVSFEGASFYGPVRRGENLTRIANQVRPSTAISVPEMMSILVAGNPEAFANGNPNTLRVGAVLKVPSPQALGVSGAPAPVPDVAAVNPVEPVESPPVLPVSPPEEAAVSPAPVALPPVAPPPTETAPAVVESTPPPMSIPPPQEIVPQTTIPQPEPQPALAQSTPPPSAATETPTPPVTATPPPSVAETPPPKPVAPPQEAGMDWLSNPVVWIAIALIVLAVGSVLLLPLLRRPTTTTIGEPSAVSVGEPGEAAARSDTRVSVRRETRSKRPVPAAAEETAAARLSSMAEPVVKSDLKAAATLPPKPIDELLKDIDFSLGDERPRAATEGKKISPAHGGAARRMPDAEPPTASVTRTPSSSAPASPAKPATPAPVPTTPQSLVEPLSELPSGLQFDKLDFDLGDLGLDSTRKPVELPPLELKPSAPAKPADWAVLDLSLPDIKPPTPSEPTLEPPKASDLKFEFTDVNQEQVRNREDLARLDEELQSFGGGLDLGKMALGSPPGGADAGADYLETKLDLAAAYLDMGDQVGARGLLEDVLQEGDAAQKKRAEDLLKKLS